MRVREAKVFLVRETAEQAELEGVPLSELEKRMMYFAEGPSASEDPAQLNAEFEAKYDTEQFEAKIPRLMSRALRRLKREDPAKAAYWDNAIRGLEKGDHYILVLSGHTGLGSLRETGVRGWRITLAILTPIVVGFALLFLAARYLPAPRPYAIRVLQALFVALLVTTIFFPEVLQPVGMIFGRYLEWIAGTDKEKEEIERE